MAEFTKNQIAEAVAASIRDGHATIVGDDGEPEVIISTRGAEQCGCPCCEGDCG